MEGSSKKSVTISEVLVQVGEYGRFQRILDAIFCLINIPIAMQILIMTFFSVAPSWKCRANSTVCMFNSTLPASDKRRCNMQRQTWEYTEKKDFSLVTQFDLHCESEWLLFLLSSIVFIGWGMGAIILGSLGDKYGRKILIFPSFTIILVLGFISPFIPNIYFLLAARFVIGFCVHGTLPQCLILIAEVVGQKQRPFAVLIVFLTTAIGWCMLSIQAYLVQNWKILSMICTGPYIFILCFYKFVPESIRWLTLQGKSDEVFRILSTIAKWNKRSIADNVTIISSPEEPTTQRSNPLDLFRTRKIAALSSALGFVWIVLIMNYFGMYMAAGDLGGSLYRDFAIFSLVDIPGLFLSVHICTRYGRKTCTLIPMLIGSIISIAIGFTPLENGFRYLRIALGFIGMLFLCIGFNGVYTWSVEIYPTNIRSTGMGFSMVAARVGSGIAPWVAKGLQSFGGWCPFVSLGAPSLIGFFIGLSLPETKTSISAVTNKKDNKEIGTEEIGIDHSLDEYV